MGQMKRKPDLQYVVHWILFVAVALGILGAVLQFIRFGGLVEPGNTGPAGQITQPATVALLHPGDSAIR